MSKLWLGIFLALAALVVLMYVSSASVQRLRQETGIAATIVTG